MCLSVGCKMEPVFVSLPFFFFFTITLPFLLQHYCVTVFPHLTVLHHQLLLDFSIILNLLPPAETRLWCLICSKLSMSAAISSWSASYICIGDKQSKRKNKTHKNKYFFFKKKAFTFQSSTSLCGSVTLQPVTPTHQHFAAWKLAFLSFLFGNVLMF